jgi:hypothetical protein
MKKILLLSLIAAFAIGFTSCKKDGPEFNRADLIGTWTSSHLYFIYKENGNVVDQGDSAIPNDEKRVLTFKDNGQVTSRGYNESEEDYTDITWSLTGNTLIFDEDLIYTVEKLDSRMLVISIADHYVGVGITYDDYERMTLTRN